jgi:hypothetical protein
VTDIDLDTPQGIIDTATKAEPEKPTVEQIEWFDDRFYRVLAPSGERYYPSVTSILSIVNKPFLSRWRGDVGNYEADRRMNHAAWRGSRIHDAIHQLLSVDKEGRRLTVEMAGQNGHPYGQDEWLNIMRFKEFYDIFKPDVIGSEVVVYSVLHEFAGTCDLLCNLKAGEYKIGSRTKVQIPEDGLYIGDVKTGKSVDDDYHYQTAAYAFASEEMGFGTPAGTFILHTSAGTNAGWNVHPRTKEQVSDDIDTFFAAQKVFNSKNPNNSPRFQKMPSSITLTEEVVNANK